MWHKLETKLYWITCSSKSLARPRSSKCSSTRFGKNVKTACSSWKVQLQYWQFNLSVVKLTSSNGWRLMKSSPRQILKVMCLARGRWERILKGLLCRKARPMLVTCVRFSRFWERSKSISTWHSIKEGKTPWKSKVWKEKECSD